MDLERGHLLANEALTGGNWCRAHSELIDAWLAELLSQATQGASRGVALVAVGGYGRSELCPNSDIDVMLVHSGRPDVAEVADRIWYPIWDEGLHLGHSVCTVAEALGLASDDFDTATALLSARRVAGEHELSDQLARDALAQWQRRSKRWLVELAARVQDRHAKAGEVAFLLEPDLKEGRGGLRDVHALGWAEAAQRTLLDLDDVQLSASYSVLLDARVELHRRTGQSANVLAFQEQDAVAAALGDPSGDDLMARIVEAARAIAWTSDDAWRRIESGRRGLLRLVAHRPRAVGPGIVLRDDEVELEHNAVVEGNPELALRIAVAAARYGAVIERRTLERLSAGTPGMPDPWPAEARSLLVEMLLTGPPAIRVVEALDQRGVWTRVIPEWQAVRARPQHNAYHRFTVDRHLLETAANAAKLATRTDRPDLLVLAALLHDLGKGHGGDHTEVGVGLARTILTRMGFPEADVASVCGLIENHLLLAEVATRRDLDDPVTIERVADAVGTIETLDLLAALTEADSVATGRAAWGPWKAELVGRLVERVAHVLEGGEIAGVVLEPFPTSAQLDQLRQPGQRIDGRGTSLTLMTNDRPGIFSRVSGVLALHGLDVLAASAYSSDDGRALAVFHVHDPLRHEPRWARVVADLELALEGRIALNARLAERVRTYHRSKHAPRWATPAILHFDNHASAAATVIEVHAPDRIGVLYRITRALADLDLDIRSAKAHSQDGQVVDSFYVRDQHGNKIVDPDRQREIELAIVHSVGE